MKITTHSWTGRRCLIICLAFVLCPFFVASKEACSKEALTDAQKAQKVFEMYENYKQSSFPDIADIAPEEALRLLGQGSTVLFVDVRSREEQAVSMLPGAITGKEFRENPNAYGDRIIISYCTISYRSGLFANEFKERGITIRNLRGGLLGWVHKGGVVYDRNKEIRLIHVYGKKWDLAPTEYKTRFFKLPFLKW